MIPLHDRHPGSGHVGPLVLGHEFVGRVTAVGDGVEGFAVGDRVVTGAGVACGECEWCHAGRTNLCAHYYTLGLHTDGGLATHARTPASICVAVPDECSDDAAAMAQPLAVAMHALNRGRVVRGESVVIIGVGGIGALMVGGASGRGIDGVIAVDVDDGRLATARELGARHTLHAEREDVVAAVRELTGGAGADLVVETVGGHGDTVDLAWELARIQGTVAVLGIFPDRVPVNLLRPVVRELWATFPICYGVIDGRHDFAVAIELIADGRAPVERLVTHHFPLDDAPEAFRTAADKGTGSVKVHLTM
jgi:(R,R)-butanediol dehydrogenase/meso-butanediol dehydrogenase/diacetyl reductase